MPAHPNTPPANHYETPPSPMEHRSLSKTAPDSLVARNNLPQTCQSLLRAALFRRNSSPRRSAHHKNYLPLQLEYADSQKESSRPDHSPPHPHARARHPRHCESCKRNNPPPPSSRDTQPRHHSRSPPRPHAKPYQHSPA